MQDHAPAAMTPGEVISKWRASELKESTTARPHFNDVAGCSGSRLRRKPTLPAPDTAVCVAQAHAVAHFVNRLVFCMFAEDVGLLAGNMFTKMLERAYRQPGRFTERARMSTGMSTGSDVGFDPVAWFNGGLFNDVPFRSSGRKSRSR